MYSEMLKMVASNSVDLDLDSIFLLLRYVMLDKRLKPSDHCFLSERGS